MDKRYKLRLISAGIFSFFLLAGSALGTPDNSMSITPSATAGTTITAADENSRNSEISTKYNAHSHADISTMSSVNTFTIGDGAAGAKTYAVNDDQSGNPAFRYNNSIGYWQLSTDGSTYDAVGLQSGNVITGSNTFRVGDNTATSRKRIIGNEDTTDGELAWNPTNNFWEESLDGTNYSALVIISGAIAATYDDILLGDGTSNAPKRLYANTAAALGVKPQIRFNTGTSAWESSNNGTVFTTLAESGTWLDVTASRSAGTVYQNTSGKKRRVIVRIQGAGTGKLDFTVNTGSTNPPGDTAQDGLIDVNATSTNHRIPAYVEVPNNWYYKLTISTGSLLNWYELDE